MKPLRLVFVQTTARLEVSVDYLKQQRTVADTQQVVKEIITQCRSLSKADRDNIQKRKGAYKKFLEEFVPLALFCDTKYPKNYLFQYCHGNQSYDAVISDADGNPHCKIEITMPHDGEADNQDNLLIVEQGWSNTRVNIDSEELDKLLALVHNAAIKKAGKNYAADVVLVIAISFQHWPNYETAATTKIKDCASTLLHLNFSGRAVYIFNTATKIIYPVQSN